MSSPDLTRLRIDRKTTRSGSGVGWLAFAGLALAIVGYLAWERWEAAHDRRLEVAVGRVIRIGGAAVQTGVSANGYVIARREAALSTDVQGRIVELWVEEGDRVEAGQMIARLDTSQLEATARRTRRELDEARASLRLARIDDRRISALVVAEVSPPADLDAARARRDESQARVEALVAALEEVEVLIGKSAVYAPFAGVVTQKNAEVGEVVSAMGSSPSSRGSVATVVDFDSLELQVEMAQTSLGAVRPDGAVLAYLDAYPEQAIVGRVRQIIPTANRQKSTVEVRIALDEVSSRVLPEMGVRVVFQPDGGAETRPTEVRVPTRAVTGGGGLVFLFIEDSVQRREVKLGASDGATTEVIGGLEGGELVVLDPTADLRAGDAVRRKEETK